MVNIYVGNLPYDTAEDELVEHFSRWGRVVRATLVFDRETGRSRGFGFVEMDEDDVARQAIASAHGSPFKGRPMTVNEARPRAATPATPDAPGSPGTPQSAIGLPHAGTTAQPAMSRGYTNRHHSSPRVPRGATPTDRPQNGAGHATGDAPANGYSRGYTNYMH